MSFGAVLYLVIAVAVIILLFQCLINVRGNQIAVLERKYIGRKMPRGRVVAMAGEVGVMARTLGPGLHVVIPFIYSARKVPFTVINEEEVGIVESIDGGSIPPGFIFARVAAGHNSFQDAEAFLKNGGEKGPQIEILAPGMYRINPVLFKVRKVPVVMIDKGKIGVITSMDGQSIPPGRLLACRVAGHSNFENGEMFLKNGGQKGPQIDILLPGTYRVNTDLFHIDVRDATIVPSGKVGLVTALDGDPLPDTEYVAKSVNAGDFQDSARFLETGGQRGPQLDVLKPGTYYVNPLMFSVEFDEVARVERGQVAVVVSNVGEEPSQVRKLIEEAAQAENIQPGTEQYKEIEARLKTGIERYVVPRGCRGIQQDVAGPGIYYLNRRAFIAYIIDTTNITIDWDNSKETTRFDPLKVVSRDGFEISVSVKVIVRVRPDQAPYMVAKIGSIENLIEHVIHPMIDSSFRNQASSTSAMNFMQDRQAEQGKAEERTRLELEKYHVECVSVLICQITLPQDLMETQTRKIIAQQQLAMYEEQQKTEQTRIATEKTRAEADQQKNLVEAEIGVKIADQNKQKAIRFAEGESESIRLRAEGEAKGIRAKGEAEGAKILAIGESTAKAYELQNKAVGQQGVTAIEIAKQVASGNIKVTPDFLVQGGSDSIGGLLAAFLTTMITAKKDAPVVSDAPKG